MSHPLDRPLWNALTGRLSHLAIGDERVVRLDPEVGVFAAAASGASEDQAALAALIRRYPGAGLIELEGSPLNQPPPGIEIVIASPCVQMTCSCLTGGAPGDLDVVSLGEADAAEMLALATLTRPGPFRSRTHSLGGFIGVLREGRLAAMAGRRMRLDGHSELSGVCTHPDFRGLGLASALSRRVVEGILAGGETAYLHAYASHDATVALYEGLGFRTRARVIYTVTA